MFDIRPSWFMFSDRFLVHTEVSKVGSNTVIVFSYAVLKAFQPQIHTFIYSLIIELVAFARS